MAARSRHAEAPARRWRARGRSRRRSAAAPSRCAALPSRPGPARPAAAAAASDAAARSDPRGRTNSRTPSRLLSQAMTISVGLLSHGDVCGRSRRRASARTGHSVGSSDAVSSHIDLAPTAQGLSRKVTLPSESVTTSAAGSHRVSAGGNSPMSTMSSLSSFKGVRPSWEVVLVRP